MNTITTYINDALIELRHVRWPTRQQAIRLSIIVIAFTVACGILFGAIDYGLSALLQYVLSFV